jgi:hypothetical protein
MFADVIETARAGALCGVPERREQSIVRSDEQTSVAGFDSDVAIAADRRIDHCQNHGVVPDVRERVGQHERTSPDVEWWNAVREIDDRARWCNSAHDRVADPDPLVAVAEIGQEDDRASHRFRSHHPNFAPVGRRCKRPRRLGVGRAGCERSARLR